MKKNLQLIQATMDQDEHYLTRALLLPIDDQERWAQIKIGLEDGVAGWVEMRLYPPTQYRNAPGNDYRTHSYLAAIKPLILHLSNGQYEQGAGEIEGRLTAADMKEAIEDYAATTGTLPSTPPDWAFSQPNILLNDPDVEIEEAPPPFGFAAMNLWFDGQESDLSVEIDIHEEENGRLKLTVTNIHVM